MKSTWKRTLALLLCMAMLSCSAVALAETAPADAEAEDAPAEALELKNAEMAILYEESTDTLLFSMEPDEHNAPASMTKVMTAILVLEYDPELSGTMVVPPEAVSPEYCSWLDTVHLEAGDELSVLDLMHYLLIVSGNEAATTLAVYVAGDIPTFVDMMNEKAAELGMADTHYEDPHGLSSASYISVNDMLTLSRYAMQNETFRGIVCQRSGVIPASATRKAAMRYKTTNRVMDPRSNPAYDGGFSKDVIGIKTGYIGKAGYNLAACMVKDDLTFYSVVMHCAPSLSGTDFVYGHYTETLKLFTYARTFSKQGYAAGDSVALVRLWGALGGDAISVTAAEDLYILLQEGAAFSPEIVIESSANAVKAGDVVGRVTVTDPFGNVRETALLAAEDAARDLLPLILLIGGGALLLAAAIVLILRASKRRKAQAQAAPDAAPDAAEPAESVESVESADTEA